MSYMQRFRLDGKVAFVTGAAGILGRHFSQGLFEAGASVVLADIDLAGSEQLAAALEAAKTSELQGALAVRCDVTDPRSISEALDRALDRFSAVHILHNNAAGKTEDLRDLFAVPEKYRPETWRKVMAINLDGMFYVAQAVGGQMARQGGGGAIIQTGSIYGILSPDPRIYEGSAYLGGPINTPAVYSASKGGVLALSRYLAVYWASSGIRVNTLTPGGVQSGQNDAFQQKYSQRVPLGRMALPEEMVGALIFLASDAASYITGQNIVVDGGLQAW